jgi:hypothetical protein
MQQASSNEVTERLSILIGSAGGDHVSIDFHKRDYEGWSGAQIHVHCDAWSGGAGGFFHRGELSQFAREIRELHRTLRGTAELRPLEPNITLVFIGDGKGHVTVEGEAVSSFASGTRLVFRFDIDQTYLTGIAEALERADGETGMKR